MNLADEALLARRALVIQLLRQLGRSSWPLLMWLLLMLAMVVEFQPNASNVEVGMVSPTDIRATERVFYTSVIRTQREQERAASAIAPFYTPPDRSQAVRQISTLGTIREFLEAVRTDSLADSEQQAAYIASLQPLQFDEAQTRSILSLSNERWEGVVDETERLVDAQMRSEIREGQLSAILRQLPNQISTSLTDEQAQLVSHWAGSLIVPNSFLDAERTEQARQAARESIAPIEITYEAGQIVVREGEIIASEQVEALQALGIQQPARPLREIAATALFLLLLVLVVCSYLYRIHPEHWTNLRVMAMFVALLVVVTLGARLIMPEHTLLTYFFPSAMAAMLVSVLLGADVALLMTVALALIVGYLTSSVELVTYTFVGGTISSMGLWRVDRLGIFVWTGVFLGIANVATVLSFALLDGSRSWTDTAALGAAALLNGATSASLALGALYVLSGFLGITTFLQLMELARPTHPLFRELLLKAPGTYHHTIIVSNLAERAAEAVGADMLLVRVGAYYHDVGKTKEPHYFVENQADGVNLHDALDDPYKSADIIVNHVREGMQLAKRYKLPRRIIDFIAQHHGTTSVAWFYRKACEQQGEAKVDPARFRYPGPPPQSREAAILMLADTVEATARAVKPAGEAEIVALIHKSVSAKLNDGQLDHCSLSISEIERIRQAFVGVLQGIYHPRLLYPEPHKPIPQLMEGSAAPALLQEESHDSYTHPTPDRPTVGSAG